MATAKNHRHQYQQEYPVAAGQLGEMAGPDSLKRIEFSLAGSPPTRAQTCSAIAAATFLTLAFVITLPFSHIQLQAISAFIPTLQGIFSIADLITAVLLYSNFAINRSHALLILADGYLFAAFITTAFSLTFPGAFTPTGFFGAGLQSAAWLYMLWHLGFSVAVLLYACLKESEGWTRVPRESINSAIGYNVSLVFLLVCGMTWAVTAHQDLLPEIFSDHRHLTNIIYYITAICLLISIFALSLLWIRRTNILDLWLMIVALAMIWELVIGITISGRYELGFYAGRLYTLFVSITVLILFIVETMKLDSRLARANESLRQERESKMMTLAATVSSISHEMRQPLLAVTMNASAAFRYLKHTPPDIETACDMLHTISGDIDRGCAILNNIRDIFKVSEDVNPAINVNEIVLGSLAVFVNDINDRGIAIRSALAPDLPDAQGHRGQLEQVLINLLNNAIEATESGSRGRSIVQVRTTLRGPTEIAITVEDSGDGIDPQSAENLFDPFVTSKAKGMGLGLAIARLIVERHGGQISASTSSALGGALFSFTLPVLSETRSGL